MILEYSIIIFITQLMFIGCRTWNIRAIADRNILQVLLSSFFVHISWLITIGIGGVSMYEIVSNFDFKYIPIILCSVIGNILGSWIGMNKTSK